MKQKTIICMVATILVVILSAHDKLIPADDLILVIASIWALGALFK